MHRRPPDAKGLDEANYCKFFVGAKFRDRILQLRVEDAAALITAPIVGAGRALVATCSYHRKMWKISRESDVLYIADEIVTGFGRLKPSLVFEEVYF